jgi:hypothetical protein
MAAPEFQEIPEPDDADVERRYRGRRVSRLRRRASSREIELEFAWILADLDRRRPNADPRELESLARERLEKLLVRDPRLEKALLELAPLEPPDRARVHQYVELAAALAVIVDVVHHIAATPSRRGRPADLSGPAAALIWMAWRGGSNIAQNSFNDVRYDSALRWALAEPLITVGDKQLYKHIQTITGR